MTLGLIPTSKKLELKDEIDHFTDEMILEEWMSRLNLNWYDDKSLNDHLEVISKAILINNDPKQIVRRCLVYLKKKDLARAKIDYRNSYRKVNDIEYLNESDLKLHISFIVYLIYTEKYSNALEICNITLDISTEKYTILRLEKYIVFLKR